ncbi:DoxX family membrane protein [Gordonia sp. SID5947]|uniref:DoxX family protein n=1 Tax=Gordonia sp. SID5947 TaxID=2690315 RepID=UPI0013720BBF|nr:DoxX family protein [Gordonia sp. SID5947]MYR05345.1 DoxX family membrane protein [Gordonia sp. SID5947]
MLIRRIARPMLATAFVASGIDALRNPAPKAEMSRDLVDKSVEALPNSVTDNVPTEPEVLVRVNGAIQVGGGILLATGKFPRFAALGLAGSLVPTTLAGHPFWEETDPAARARQRTQFYKNVSLLGGLLIAAVDTEGKPSLAWRGRRKAGEAGQAITAALPIGVAASESTWDTIRERSAEGAHVLGERSADAAEVIKNRAPGIAEAARDRSIEAAEVIKHRAPEIAEAARDRSVEAAELIRHRGPELAGAAQKRSADLAEAAQKRSEKVTKAAQKRSDKATKAAQKRSDKATKAAEKRVTKAADRIKDRAPEIADQAAALAGSAKDKAYDGAEEGRRRWREARS